MLAYVCVSKWRHVSALCVSSAEKEEEGPGAEQYPSGLALVENKEETYQDALAHRGVSLKQDIDAFLLSLPLGTSRGDALVEEAVAERLYDAQLSRAALQLKLNEW